MADPTTSSTPLIDEIYQKLSMAMERVASQGVMRPKYHVYLTIRQYQQLRREAISLRLEVLSVKVSSSHLDEFIFGQKIIVVDETPYVRLVEEGRRD